MQERRDIYVGPPTFFLGPAVPPPPIFHPRIATGSKALWRLLDRMVSIFSISQSHLRKSVHIYSRYV